MLLEFYCVGIFLAKGIWDLVGLNVNKKAIRHFMCLVELEEIIFFFDQFLAPGKFL